MKKLVLSVFSLAVALSANAQTCVSGYTPTVIFNEFSSNTDPGTATEGLYAFGKDALGGLENPNFKAAITRDSAASALKVVVTQAEGEYIPFGISFGGDPATPNTANFTTDATFAIKVTNKSAKTKIRFRMALQDINNVNADTYAKGKLDPSTFYTEIIELKVAAGASATLEGTYAGAGQANYNPPYDNSTNTFTDVDLTKIKAVLFTVLNDSVNANYQGLKLTDLPIEIDYVRVGKCTRVAPIGIVDNSSVVSSNVYPNPTSDIANVSLDLKEVSDVKVTLVDIFGKEVKVVTEGKFSSVKESVNVSDLAKGIYTVNYSVNGSTVKAKLLMVK